MFRTLTTNSIKQSQRTSTKAFQYPSHQNQNHHSRLLSTLEPSAISANVNIGVSSAKGHGYDRDHNNRQRRHNNNNGNNGRSHYSTSSQSVGHMAPFENPLKNYQLVEFDTCLSKNSTYDLATGMVNSGLKHFWSSVSRSIELYEPLKLTNSLNEERLGEFVSLLRNALRINRLELSRLRNNLDKDSDNPLKRYSEIITCVLRQISYDLLNGLIKLNPHGLTHLFKSYKDLGLSYEAVHIWRTGKDLPYLSQPFTSEPVLGAILPFIVESEDFNFDEMFQIYEKIKASKLPNEKIHNELQVGMIRACLFKNRNIDALNIFEKLSTDIYQYHDDHNINNNHTNNQNLESSNRNSHHSFDPPMNVKSYLTMAHLSFIGYCKDIDTANVFFTDAINESMPYPTPLQLNFIKRYISNIYEMKHDYYKVKEIWLRTWRHYELKKSSNPSVSSSLNDSFLTIFFKEFPVFSAQGFLEFQDILNNYVQIRGLDEPFINVLLSKSTIWQNIDVFETILSASDSFGLNKTAVFYRCSLKACGSINISSDKILLLFQNLMQINIDSKYRHIAHADWMSLRDATINAPIFHTLPDDAKSARIDLYFKLWKLCSPYFSKPESFKNYMNKDMLLDSNYARILQQIDRVNTSDVDLPQIKTFMLTPGFGKNYR